MSTRPILLVEDNRDDVELTVMAFTEARITNPVVVVRNGVEALDYLFCTGAYAGRQPPVQPVVVLLDIKLPMLTGIEVLERMRRDPRTRRTPVVMLTSSTEPADVASTYDLGANSYVRKPVEFDSFVAAARNLGLYWTILNQPPEAPAHAGAAGLGGTIHVLLVEDNSDDVELTRILLGKTGLSCHLDAVSTLARAVDRLATTRVDIVLLDLRLPDGSGARAVEVIAEAAGATPVFALTGSLNDPALVQAALSAGARLCLSKSEMTADRLQRLLRDGANRV